MQSKRKWQTRAIALFLVCMFGVTAVGCTRTEGAESAESTGFSDGSAASADEASSAESSENEPTGSGTDPAPEESRPTQSGAGSGTKGTKATGSQTAATSAGKPSGTKPRVKDMKGRTFVVGADWAEDVEGTSTAADEYWETKRYVESTYKCKIKHLMVVGDDKKALTTSILAGKPNCDWFVTTSDVFQLVKAKCLYPLNKLSALDLKDSKWSKFVIDYATVDGNVYGLREDHVDFRTLLLYNKSLIKDGDDLNTLAKKGQLTWDKMFDIAKKVTKGDTYGIVGSMDINDLVTAMIAANGGKAVTRGKGLDFSYTFDSVNTRNALKTVQEWTAADIVLPTAGMTYLYAQNQFAKGKVGMFIADEWQIDFACAKAKFDVGCVLLPAGPNADEALIDQSLTAVKCIAATAEAPEDVATIIDAMASYVPKKKTDWLDVWRDRFSDEDSIQTITRYAEAVRKGDCFVDYRPVIAGDIYSNGVYDLLARVAYGRETPQTFLESTAQIFKKSINDFKK